MRENKAILDAGFKGMYGGLNQQQIKKRKAIPQAENLCDRMDATELAANQFRATQTCDKLARQRIQNERLAIKTYRAVGKKVRQAIQRIGGTMPEDLPAAEHKRRTGSVGILRHRRFLEETNKAFADLKRNPRAWKEEMEDRRIWGAAH